MLSSIISNGSSHKVVGNSIWMSLMFRFIICTSVALLALIAMVGFSLSLSIIDKFEFTFPLVEALMVYNN